MFPKAVREGLVVREVRGECVVYHSRDRRICRLNRTALFVWRQCDGSRSIAEMAGHLAAEAALPADEGLIRSTLGDLRRFGLVEFPEPAERVETRRELMVRLAKTAAVAAIMPLVVAVASPASAAAKVVVSQVGGPCGSQATIPESPTPNVPGRPSFGTQLAPGTVFVCAPGLECVNGKCATSAAPCIPDGDPCSEEGPPCCSGIKNCDGKCYPD